MWRCRAAVNHSSASDSMVWLFKELWHRNELNFRTSLRWYEQQRKHMNFVEKLHFEEVIKKREERAVDWLYLCSVPSLRKGNSIKTNYSLFYFSWGVEGQKGVKKYFESLDWARLSFKSVSLSWKTVREGCKFSSSVLPFLCTY